MRYGGSFEIVEIKYLQAEQCQQQTLILLTAITAILLALL